jgi:hypothetical protein
MVMNADSFHVLTQLPVNQTRGPTRVPNPNSIRPDINKIYKHPALHFQNFPHKLELLAMLSSFTGRITTPTPVISVIGAVVVISVGVVVKVPV